MMECYFLCCENMDISRCWWMMCCESVDASGWCAMEMQMPVDDMLWQCGCQWMMCYRNVDASGWWMMLSLFRKPCRMPAQNGTATRKWWNSARRTSAIRWVVTASLQLLQYCPLCTEWSLLSLPLSSEWSPLSLQLLQCCPLSSQWSPLSLQLLQYCPLCSQWSLLSLQLLRYCQWCRQVFKTLDFVRKLYASFLSVCLSVCLSLSLSQIFIYLYFHEIFTVFLFPCGHQCLFFF